MTPAMTDYGIDRLSDADKIALAHEILGSVEQDSQISNEWKQEIDRRLDSHVANPDAAIPWEQARRASEGNPITSAR